MRRHLRRRTVFTDDNDRNRQSTQEDILWTFSDKPAHVAIHDDLVDTVLAYLAKDTVREESDLNEEFMVSNGTVMEKRLQHTEAFPGPEFDAVSEFKNLFLLVGLDKPV